MTFDDAVQLKSEQSSTFIEGGITYKVFVTPDSENDFMTYLKYVRGFFNQLTDEDALKYSRNRQFCLRGLNYMRPNILFLKL